MRNLNPELAVGKGKKHRIHKKSGIGVPNQLPLEAGERTKERKAAGNSVLEVEPTDNFPTFHSVQPNNSLQKIEILYSQRVERIFGLSL